MSPDLPLYVSAATHTLGRRARSPPQCSRTPERTATPQVVQRRTPLNLASIHQVIFSGVRAIVLTGRGGPSDLRVQSRPDPAPAPGELLVEVRAAGVNFADLLATQGLYPDAPKP